MNIILYNTMTSKKEEFKPIVEGKVGMYVCGVTVYDYTHIGHGRSSVAFDVIRRFFEYKGYDVTFVKNFTDVDDKIINRANENHELWSELSERFIKEHDADMDSLYIKRPTYTPMATKYIEKMIDYCERLIEKGNAYAVDGDVYFRVNSFKEYGRLSGRNLEDMIAGARVDVNDKKENPLDFALWKAAKPDEPSWKSPWGQGRPGWHIECSVMSEAILGSNIDIHGGGQDLIFPHHENEIAQSEAISCSTFANYWIHNGFVNINKEKMSKSLNNFFTIRDILKICHPEALRLLFLMTHYRQPLEYSEDKLKEASSALHRIYIFLDEAAHLTGSKKGKNLKQEIGDMKSHFIKEFEESMNDDFNTPKAVAAIFEIVRMGNTIIAGKPDTESAEHLKEVSSYIFDIVSKVLGIINHSADEWYKSNLKIPVQEVEALILKRAEARKNKDFALADSVRAELTEKGIEIIDTLDGTRFRTLV
ncbi:cysteine--tRNA ligase [Mucispirillum schaedleri]|uniref:Cysteine--tRNA ligase n=1 Tax=Mucispirillum schaedleri ASF457 TaxID=1379858 RepID=V2PYV1_9BACT|nr:cysteine--tRNA ligase [Mucispirillum schaedleri]MCX4360747.1 cysteine--tRNA ligase [Mucispirillum schaedleri]USF24740.1 Cysteine--tRNA ligase [Mucispirillum schaedleri ASF457]SIW05734.1 Cysteine--tRNA ligase [Mucispirillum schaedleri ASF457]